MHPLVLTLPKCTIFVPLAARHHKRRNSPCRGKKIHKLFIHWKKNMSNSKQPQHPFYSTSIRLCSEPQGLIKHALLHLLSAWLPLRSLPTLSNPVILRPYCCGALVHLTAALQVELEHLALDHCAQGDIAEYAAERRHDEEKD